MRAATTVVPPLSHPSRRATPWRCLSVCRKPSVRAPFTLSASSSGLRPPVNTNRCAIYYMCYFDQSQVLKTAFFLLTLQRPWLKCDILGVSPRSDDFVGKRILYLLLTDKNETKFCFVSFLPSKLLPMRFENCGSKIFFLSGG